MAEWTPVIVGEQLGDTEGDEAETTGGDLIIAATNPWTVVEPPE